MTIFTKAKTRINASFVEWKKEDIAMNEHIFISHATPEDNEFTIWLASRLEMMGYNVWIDKNNLLGGERFWPTIQKAVQNSSKVLLVYSKHIVTEEGVLKQGVENEIEYAKSIANGRDGR